MEGFSFEKAAKFSRKDEFFDINYLWVPGLRWTLERLYRTPLRPEAVVLLALMCGIISSWLYSKEGYLFPLAGLIFIQLKNFFDTLDGYLARARNQQSRLGRFLDSLADALVYICLFTAIALNTGRDGTFFKGFILSYAAMISAFLQCSVYNYYLVSYKTYLQGEGINRTDERFRNKELREDGGIITDRLLFSMQWAYQWIYGWQDRIIEFLDDISVKTYEKRIGETSGGYIASSWYADKKFLSLISPLCFGTQILFLSVFTITDNLDGFLWFILTAGNIYAASLLLWRALLK